VNVFTTVEKIQDAVPTGTPRVAGTGPDTRYTTVAAVGRTEASTKLEFITGLASLFLLALSTLAFLLTIAVDIYPIFVAGEVLLGLAFILFAISLLLLVIHSYSELPVSWDSLSRNKSE
jgi:hypothetical protein